MKKLNGAIWTLVLALTMVMFSVGTVSADEEKPLEFGEQVSYTSVNADNSISRTAGIDVLKDEPKNEYWMKVDVTESGRIYRFLVGRDDEYDIKAIESVELYKDNISNKIETLAERNDFGYSWVNYISSGLKVNKGDTYYLRFVIDTDAIKDNVDYAYRIGVELNDGMYHAGSFEDPFTSKVGFFDQYYDDLTPGDYWYRISCKTTGKLDIVQNSAVNRISAVALYDSNRNKLQDLKKSNVSDGSRDYFEMKVNVKAGKSYYLKSTVDKNYSSELMITTKICPKAVVLTSVKAQKKAMKISWKKCSDKIKEYEINYSTYKDFSSCTVEKVKYTGKVSSKTIKGVKSNKKYYVRIRTVGEGYEGASTWSKIKSCKIK